MQVSKQELNIISVASVSGPRLQQQSHREIFREMFSHCLRKISLAARPKTAFISECLSQCDVGPLFWCHD